MRLLEEAGNVLRKHGYLLSFLHEDMLQFEDDTLLGFICELPLKSILDSWTNRQDEFLKRNAISLRNSALKSWNLYSVFISSDVPDEIEQRAVVEIEEDFRATRKIVQTGITTASEIMRALYPFIPIQNVAAVEAADSLRKLQERLSGLPKDAVTVLLDERISEDSLPTIFKEAHETKTD